MTRIAIVAASEITVKAFLRDHIAALARHYQVHLLVNTADPNLAAGLGAPVEVTPIAIVRNIAPLADLRALMHLIRVLRRGNFDLVHSVTPKAGLLAMLAGVLARVPLRLHIFTGQVWLTRHGPMRELLRCADKLIAALATHILVDSPSQRAFLIEQGIVAAAKSKVLAQGSICGVDGERFKPDAAAREAVRRQLGLPDNGIVFLYLGRLSRDKGLLDLARAFAAIDATSAHLLLVGPDEDNLQSEIRALAANNASRLHFVGYTDRPEDYFAAADVFCLPSYREGFGTTIIEAAAAGVPAIGSRIYGITDAIVEGETGLLFEAGDVQQLAHSMRTLAGDKSLRTRMGEKSRQRAVRDFSSAVVTAALLEHYEKLLAHRAG